MAKVSFNAEIEKFGQKGEKTGWTYFEVPFDIAEKLSPSNRKSFRVKGSLDDIRISGVALIPMGEGNFIMPLKADIRKLIKKSKGDHLLVKLEPDKEEYQLNALMMECLNDDQQALTNFNKIPRSHQNYYSKYIDSAKTEPTKAKRIAQVVKAMHYKWTYAEMLREGRNIRNDV